MMLWVFIIAVSLSRVMREALESSERASENLSSVCGLFFPISAGLVFLQNNFRDSFSIQKVRSLQVDSDLSEDHRVSIQLQESVMVGRPGTLSHSRTEQIISEHRLVVMFSET